MSNFTINVCVNVGVTPELLSVLSNLLHTRSVEAVAASNNQPPKAIATDATAKQPTPEPAPVETAPSPEPEAKEKEYTEVEVRAAMDKCRKRIEGEDYKQQTSSEAYKKYHRALTELFKRIASQYGSDRPSTLPDNDSRRKFIEDCENIKISNTSGEVYVDDDLPF